MFLELGIGFFFGILVTAYVGTYDNFPESVKKGVNFVKQKLDAYLN